MRIIPVLDLLGGVVVRAIGGQRQHYAPIQSQLVDQPDPLHVAMRLLEVSAARELYVADLDAILDAKPIADSVAEIVEKLKIPVWLDAGFRAQPTSLPPLIQPVLGSETFGPPRASLPGSAYSLDLRKGVPIGCPGETALGLADLAVQAGFSTLIVLDLAQVGVNRGIGTLKLLNAIRQRFPKLTLFAGGGVRDQTDWQMLNDLGLDGALVATALHDGRLRFT